MATRYSGNLVIRVLYDDRGDYKCSVTGPGGNWRGRVRPAPAGFGAGVGYDSPRAYDEIARSAVSFAESEVPGIMDEAHMNVDGVVGVARSKVHAWDTPIAHSPVRGHKAGLKFVVRGKSGKVAGRYHTKAEAEHRIAQLKANAERLRAFRFGKR
jgi:hypothetical protein